MDISTLRFDDKGLIPAIVVDEDTSQVLMLGYMNEESLRLTIQRGKTTFFSRSRQALWLKGETSGNYQHVVSITPDCDGDTLKIVVRKDGPACHLNTDTCFDREPIFMGEAPGFSLEGLMDLLRERKANLPAGSYTSYLFEKGLDKILKKVGEETTEVIIAAKAEDKKETVYEIADLAYHVMVLMTQAGISLQDVRAELASRHVVDKKVKQEKMT